MKRILTIALTLLMLSACGAPAEQPISQAELVSPGPETGSVKTAADENGYLIPSSWSEETVNDGSFGYVTKDAGLDLSDDFTVCGGYLVTAERDPEAGTVTFTRRTLTANGTIRAE